MQGGDMNAEQIHEMVQTASEQDLQANKLRQLNEPPNLQPASSNTEAPQPFILLDRICFFFLRKILFPRMSITTRLPTS